MTILFASGDVGGARALMPVIQLCAESCLPFAVLQHGFIVQESHPDWPMIPCPRELAGRSLIGLLNRHDIRTLVFASSIEDIAALRLARSAQELGIPVIHLLDNWSSYRRRLETDGLPTFRPDYYAVMDERALLESVQDGVDRTSLVVTGQPILAGLGDVLASSGEETRRGELERLGFDPERPLITFVSEPVAQDQGTSADSPHYRGYVEEEVLCMFLEALQPLANRLQIGVLPHPRENPTAVQEMWERYRGALQGGLLRLAHGRNCLRFSDGVAGMASILLYEAWLLSLPVLSLQPGLRLAHLHLLEGREGVAFIGARQGARETVQQWAAGVRRTSLLSPRLDLILHQRAAHHVLHLIRQCLEKSQTSLKLLTG